MLALLVVAAMTDCFIQKAKAAPGAESATRTNSSRLFDVRVFGARGDGKTLDTAALQSAINAASTTGGGVVQFPSGTYLSGSLHLKSHVHLQFAASATLLGSASFGDYEKGAAYALLLADHQTDIRISGEGTVDGQGRQLARDVMRRAVAGEFGPENPELRQNQERDLQLPDAEFGPQTKKDRVGELRRPKLLEFRDCQQVTISGVTLRNSSSWVQNYIGCQGLRIDAIKVDSVAYWNNDGMDITDCRDVKVSNCDVNSADDGICLKSNHGGKGCWDIEISDCRIRSSASALKFGTASWSGFHRIHANRLSIRDTFRSAVALESVDGGVLDDVVVEHVHATNTGNAICLRLGQRNTNAPPGIVRNVVIRDLQVEVPAGKPDVGYEIPGPELKVPHNLIPASITGLPGHPVQGVVLENIEIIYAGGGTPQRARVSLDALQHLPEKAEHYPEFSMFGELPAWGFYLRHVKDVSFNNVRLTLKETDFRPALVCDDVDGLYLNEVTFGPSSGEPVIVLYDSQGARFQNIHYPAGSREKIRLLGGSSAPEKSVNQAGAPSKSNASPRKSE